MLVWMSDIRTIDSGDVDTVLLLVVFHPLAKVQMSLLRIAVIAAAIAAGLSAFLLKLQRDIEIMGPDILAQDKAVAVTEQDHSPHYIKFVFDKHSSQ